MLGCGGSQKEALPPDFNRSILVDFQGAKISSDTGFLLLREMDERFDIIGPCVIASKTEGHPFIPGIPWSR